MQVNTKRPKMTVGRAAVISLMQVYAVPGYRVTMLEIEKLAYFLQEAGELLKLPFEKGQYGPYTEILHPVLQRMEGHFIRGYGDRSSGAAIHLLPHASDEAAVFLRNNSDTRDRLAQVERLIEGFETPYGLELLATIHWLAHREDAQVAVDIDAAIRGVHGWNERKHRFPAAHIRVAWNHLKDLDWLSLPELASVPM